MISKLLHLLIFLALFLNHLQAQPPGGGARQMGGAKMPSIGRIYGKAIDSKTKKPVDYASVTLLALQKDSMISGVLAESNGDFNMEKLPFGRFRLRIQFIGYKPFTLPIAITPNTVEQDLGDLKVEPDTKQLNDVVIEGERAPVVMSIDRRTYNVDKDISSRGGTAIDVMKNIPGLTVDADGNVALRNNSPIVYIDGRPTTLTLEQVPADQIDRIEVITNPSAKFDASASGGIVNVVMKTNTKPGYNGMVGASIGTNNRYAVNGNINIKEKPFNFFASYNFNARQNPSKGYTNRTNLSNEIPTGSYNQNNSNLSGNQMNNGRFGFDYYVNNRNTLTLSQNIMAGNFNTDDNQTFTQRNASDSILSQGTRTTDQLTNFNNYNSQLMWKRTYPKQGKEWTTDISYNNGKQSSDALYTTTNYSGSGATLPDNPQLQKNIGSGKNQMVNFQFDYTNPLTDSSKFEWGVKSNYNTSRTGLNVNNFDYAENVYVPDTFLTNDYKINTFINATYINYSGYLPFGGIGYQAGVRFEQTNFRSELLNKGLSFDYIYPDGTKNLAKAFFPSLYLSKKINERNEVQLNFSRKIDRPGRMQIMPYIMFSDKLNYQIGNPTLAPEFINLAEVNYNSIWDKVSWLTSAYVRYNQDPITQYVYRSTTDSNVLITTFINGEANASYGWENTVKFSFFKRKMDLTLSGNTYHVTINANTASGTLENSGWSWNAKAMASYKLPAAFTVQLNGSYEAPKIVTQGTTIPVYSMDFSLNKDVGKKLSFNFTINDIFNTRRFGSDFSTDYFTQDLSRRRDVRFFRVGFTYRFGEWDTSLFRKRKAPNKDSQGGGMDMDF
jgi:iron complex outermembrane receptor protein